MNRRSRVRAAVLLVAALLAGCDNFSLFDELEAIAAGDLRIVPSSAVVGTNGAYNFVAIGGEPPYDFQLLSGDGTLEFVSDTTRRYKAPASQTLAILQLIDAEGTTSTARVNVLEPQVLTLNPPSMTLPVSASYAFYGLGGTPPFTYSVFNPPTPTGGVINAGTGLYTAPASDPGTVTLRVTDDAGAWSDASVEIVSSGAIGISPTAATVEQGKSLSFSGYGGTPSYTYSVSGGSGAATVNSANGLFTALAAAVPGETYTVAVTDSVMASASATVTIAPAAPTNLFANGYWPGPLDILLSWQDNATGETGYEIWQKKAWGPFELIHTTAANAELYEVTGLSPGTAYTFKVRAIKDMDPDPDIYSDFSDLAFDIPNP